MTTAILLDRERIRRWCGSTLVVQAAVAVFIVLGTHGLIVTLHSANTTDFISFYAAGLIADGPRPASVYDPALHYAVEQAVTAPSIGYVHFFYPPVFLLPCAVLARLPYLVAFVVFEAASGALLLLALRAVLRPTDRCWLLPVLSFSPLLWNFGLGQNACLTAGLLCWGCLLLERRRDVWAGVVLSLLLYKPHAGLLIPVALVAARRWGAVAGAAGGVAVLVGVSVLCFGVTPWFAFASRLLRGSGEFSRAEVVPFAALASTYGAARLVGFGHGAAFVVEAAVDALVGALVWVAWRDRAPAGQERRFAMLASGVPLVMPVVLFYDTVLLLVCAAWLVRAAERGARVRFGWLAAVWLLGLVGYPLARATQLPVASLSVALCFTAATMACGNSGFLKNRALISGDANRTRVLSRFPGTRHLRRIP